MRHRLLIVWPSLASGIPRILNFHLMDARFFYAVMEMWLRDSVHPFLILLCKRCVFQREHRRSKEYRKWLHWKWGTFLYQKNKVALSKILLFKFYVISRTFLEVSLLAWVIKFYNHCWQENWMFFEGMLINALLVPFFFFLSHWLLLHFVNLCRQKEHYIFCDLIFLAVFRWTFLFCLSES